MTRIILITALSFVIKATYGQSDNFGSWMVRIESGIEAHDKRSRIMTIRENPSHKQADEKWGTYHLGMDLQRKIIAYDRLGIYGGIGISYENATYLRPFNHGHFSDGPIDYVLRHTNRYRKVSTPINLNTFFRIYEQLYITSDIRLNWLVYRSISHSDASGSFRFPYAESTFELDDIHLRLGILYRFGNLSIGLTSRIENYQKIDRILFNPSPSVIAIDQRWESYNPLRFDLTVGYTWGQKKLDMSHDEQKYNP